MNEEKDNNPPGRREEERNDNNVYLANRSRIPSLRFNSSLGLKTGILERFV